MFGDKDNENMNFDSIPDISFNNNGQPVGGFGMPGSFSEGQGPQSNGQFIPPMGMGVDDHSSSNNNDMNIGMNSAPFNNAPLTNTTPTTTVVEPVNSGAKGDFNMFKCNSCNSTFGVSNGGVVEQCIICGEHEVINANFNGNRIDGFIPFSVSKNKAIEAYKSKVMLNPVIPFCFKSSNTINSIKKVYIPGFLYNTITSGDVNVLGADQTPNGKAKFDVVFNDTVEHNNLFYKSSSKINERVFNAVSNFNFNNVTTFNPNNIGQCYCLDSDLNQGDINAKVEDNCKKHVIAMTRKKVNHQMRKVVGNSLVTQINSVQNVLVPVYLLNVRYGGKDYMYVMNGETGESSLDVTNGILEMIIFGLIVGLIVFGIAVGISTLF